MNASSDFMQCHAVTEKWEGGWSDHPSDRGGKTMYGVTEAVYHAWLKKHKKPIKPVKNISIAEAREIYYHEYWLAAKCETLAKGVDLAVYDAAVNSGVSRSRKWLMASIGGSDTQTIKKICATRLGFMRSLSNWAVFGKGWLNRVTDIEAKAVSRHLLSEKNSVSGTKEALKSESDKAEKLAKDNQSGAVGTGALSTTAGGTGYVFTPEEADVLLNWIVGASVVIALFALAYFILKSVIHSSRSKAYERAANEVTK